MNPGLALRQNSQQPDSQQVSTQLHPGTRNRRVKLLFSELNPDFLGYEVLTKGRDQLLQKRCCGEVVFALVGVGTRWSAGFILHMGDKVGLEVHFIELSNNHTPFRSLMPLFPGP